MKKTILAFSRVSPSVLDPYNESTTGNHEPFHNLTHAWLLRLCDRRVLADQVSLV